MKVFELGMSVDYVSRWGFWEAVREVCQNILDEVEDTVAIDALTYDWSNGLKASILVYDAKKQMLALGNTKSKLEAKTLLLGVTSKDGVAGKIGHYGEGYKLAVTTFLRLGHRVVIQNGDLTWEASIRFSDTFGTVVVAITEDANPNYKPGQEQNVVFEIHGVTPAHMQEINGKLLLDRFGANKIVSGIPGDNSVDCIETDKGRVLLDDKYRGMVYVKGLFVCDMRKRSADPDKLAFGYDFEPGEVPLDRDRNSVAEYNLFWATSAVIHAWLKSDSEVNNQKFSLERLRNVIKDNSDTRYVSRFDDLSRAEKAVELSKLHWEEFKRVHGENAYPVDSHNGVKKLTRDYEGIKPVVVGDDTVYNMLTLNNAHEEVLERAEKKEFVADKKASPSEVLFLFKERHVDNFNSDMLAEFQGIMDISSGWRVAAARKRKVETVKG